MALQNLIGLTFSRLTVVARAESTKYGDGRIRTNWLCQCLCGKTITARADQLKSKNTKSCGCLHSEWAKSGRARRTHGYASVTNASNEHGIWCSMKARCRNKKSPAYKNYGGRGITVCDRWLNSFQFFIDDMGSRPSKNHSIERLDNDAGYSPENCVWTTWTEQCANRRPNIPITDNGRTMLISHWAKELKINSQTLERRYHAGWSHHDIVNKPVQ